MSKQTVLQVGLPLVTGQILQGFVALLEAIQKLEVIEEGKTSSHVSK
jgi:hypothetical protein